MSALSGALACKLFLFFSAVGLCLEKNKMCLQMRWHNMVHLIIFSLLIALSMSFIWLGAFPLYALSTVILFFSNAFITFCAAAI